MFYEGLYLYQKTGVNTARTLYKEIQMGSGAKSYMRKGFLIFEEMRKYLVIYEEALSHIWLSTAPVWIS